MSQQTSRLSSAFLPPRRGAFTELAAGAALVLVWVVLWSWLIAGVAGPAHTAAELASRKAPPGETVALGAAPGVEAPRGINPRPRRDP